MSLHMLRAGSCISEDNALRPRAICQAGPSCAVHTISEISSAKPAAHSAPPRVQANQHKPDLRRLTAVFLFPFHPHNHIDMGASLFLVLAACLAVITRHGSLHDADTTGRLLCTARVMVQRMLSIRPCVHLFRTVVVPQLTWFGSFRSALDLAMSLWAQPKAMPFLPKRA
jgi:hypothetical protein